MKIGHKITPCLWFEHQAEEAANFYISLFPESKITAISRYCGAGEEIHGRPAGSVMVVAFDLAGQGFTALNGGPVFRFNEAVSLQVNCESQAEIDDLWEKLGAGGDPAAQQCGWLKDRYGLSWQIVPSQMGQLFTGIDGEQLNRRMAALLQMKKIDIATLQNA